MVDIEKYRALFVEESRDHVDTLSQKLLELERAGDTPEAGSAALEEAFRAAHSLKGMGASMGFEPFTQLSHHLENLIDRARSGATLPRAQFDLLLAAADALGEMVLQAEAGRDQDMNADALLAQLRTTHDATTSDAQATAPASAGPSLVVELVPDAPAKAARALIIYKRLAKAPGFAQTWPEKSALMATDLDVTPLRITFEPGTALDDLAEIARALPAVARVSIESAQSTALPTEVADAPGGARLRVDFQPELQALQVRAFMVYRALSASTGFVSSTPDEAALRGGKLPERALVCTFDHTADLDALTALAQRQIGVADVTRLALEPEAPRAAPTAAPLRRTVKVRTDVLDGVIDTVGELLLARARLRALAARASVPGLDDVVDEIDRLSRELHERAVATRMMPIGTITHQLPRVVRDLSHQLERPVTFDMHGTDIELDRAILDELLGPLIHLVRNAVDHGHDGADVRMRLGKPPEMHLALSVRRDRDHVLLTLEDDGAGMDPAALLKRALSRGIIDADRAAELTHAHILQLICQPGFSTAPTVTETSGRGVGMDVVKAVVERLGGSLSIASQKGRGSTFTLRLPLSVAIVQVLVVEAGDERGQHPFALPIGRVERSVQLDAGTAREAGGRQYLDLEGHLVPLFELGALLGFSPQAARAGDIAIIVAAGQTGKLALRVGAVRGQEEILVKPLGRPLSSVRYLSGGAMLSDGRAAFILEPSGLVEGMRLPERPSSAASTPAARA